MDFNWTSQDIFRLAGLSFRVVERDWNNYKTTRDEIVLLKSPALLKRYCSLIGDLRPNRILEVGIFQGGGLLLLGAISSATVVGIDRSDPLPILSDILLQHPLGRRVSCVFNVSQDDSKRVSEVIKNRFNQCTLDLVIDDASHQYEPSKATFEAVFPYIRPGGIYIIEDWGWAHWPDYQNPSHQWSQKPALTNLVYDLVALTASQPGIISRVEITNPWVVIERGPKLLTEGSFAIDPYLATRGRAVNRI